MELIRTEGLYKSYSSGLKTIEVLKGVNLSLEEGKIVAILGASGVGKSTLLHIMGLLDKPTRGEIFWRGKNLSQHTEKMRASFRNNKIGFVFQFYHLLPEFSALENAMMPALVGGKAKKDAERSARSLLQEVGLGERLDNKPGELSGGEQQRVAIARALIQTPPLLLADEPTGNLDTHSGDEIFSLLLKINKEKGTTMLIVTHNERLADKVPMRLRMIDGKIYEEGGRG